MAALYDQWAKYYDIAEADRSVFIDFYGSLISPGMRSLLELGCGTGVIITALAQRMAEYNGGHAGNRVTGVDESTEMLRIARSRDDRVEWIVGDFRSLPVSGEYDLVVCCFNVLQMMLEEKDLAAVFHGAQQHLTPGGIFAFDIYQPNLAYLTKPQTNRLIRTVRDERARTLELREDFAYDPATYILSLDWRLIDPGSSAPPLATMYYQIRQYFASDIDRLLAAAGLVVKQRYGDFDRTPFTSNSKKQILVCGRS